MSRLARARVKLAELLNINPASLYNLQ